MHKRPVEPLEAHPAPCYKISEAGGQVRPASRFTARESCPGSAKIARPVVVSQRFVEEVRRALQLRSSFEVRRFPSMGEGKHIAAGTRVRVAQPMPVPQWSECDDDKGRTSVPTKQRLQLLFFRGDKKVAAEVVYISNETERERLRRLGRVKVRIREASGAMVTCTAPADTLCKVG